MEQTEKFITDEPKIKTAKAMREYGNTLPPSFERAQCFAIARILENICSEKTIAACIVDDHTTPSHAYRHAHALMIPAGCARESGTRGLQFRDGSSFSIF